MEEGVIFTSQSQVKNIILTPSAEDEKTAEEGAATAETVAVSGSAASVEDTVANVNDAVAAEGEGDEITSSEGESTEGDAADVVTAAAIKESAVESESAAVREGMLSRAEVEALVAEAEHRGYLRGRNEQIECKMSAPGLYQRAGEVSRPVRKAEEVMILNNPRRSVWD